jgi:hypothetical protein
MEQDLRYLPLWSYNKIAYIFPQVRKIAYLQGVHEYYPLFVGQSMFDSCNKGNYLSYLSVIVLFE